MSISFFDDLGSLFSHFGQLSLLGLLGRSSEVEHNPKTNISFFEDFFQSWEGGGYIGQFKSNFGSESPSVQAPTSQSSILGRLD